MVTRSKHFGELEMNILCDGSTYAGGEQFVHLETVEAVHDELASSPSKFCEQQFSAIVGINIDGVHEFHAWVEIEITRVTDLCEDAFQLAVVIDTRNHGHREAAPHHVHRALFGQAGKLARRRN